MFKPDLSRSQRSYDMIIQSISREKHSILETTVERIVFRNRAEEHKLRYMTAYLEELREQYLSFLTFLRESDKRVLYLKHEVAVTPSELDTIVRFIETV